MDLIGFTCGLDPFNSILLTCPDMAFALNKWSQIMLWPTMQRRIMLKRLIRHLRGTSFHGLFICRHFLFSLNAFSLIQIGRQRRWLHLNKLSYGFSWSQCNCLELPYIAHSYTESKNEVVASIAFEALSIKSLLFELGVQFPSIQVIYYDNDCTIYLCSNPIFHSRMIHIEIDFSLNLWSYSKWWAPKYVMFIPRNNLQMP